MKSKEAWIAWPSRDCFVAFGYCYALLTVLWIVVYGGACWVTSLHRYRLQLHTPADLAMPFVPSAAAVYLSLFPLTWLAPLVLRTPDRLRSFARALAVLYVCSGLGFLLIPSEEVRPSKVVEGLDGYLFHFADRINLSYNNLPCLHVGMAVLTAHFYTQHKRLLATVLVWLWAFAISLSTLLTHQHYLLDVAAGAGLAVLVARYSSTLRFRQRL